MKKSLALFCSIFAMNVMATDYSLKGTWFNQDEELKFISLGGFYHFTGRENFVYPYGEFSHYIEQTVKIEAKHTQSFTGTVDIFDSRGCSFKQLAIKGEFQDDDEVSFLITYPRYQVVKTVYPYTKIECKLLEYVETPVTLQRKR